MATYWFKPPSPLGQHLTKLTDAKLRSKAYLQLATDKTEQK